MQRETTAVKKLSDVTVSTVNVHEILSSKENGNEKYGDLCVMNYRRVL